MWIEPIKQSMWIEHNNELFNLNHFYSIEKYFSAYIRLNSIDDHTDLAFDNQKERDEFYLKIRDMLLENNTV